ncbi:MAG: hypothetical protein IJ097_02205 [Bacilli bacterium]|nr:hypothetical protein [Bacilli bacterium]
MLDLKDEINWSNYVKNYKSLMNYGKIQGLVKEYDNELLENLRYIYCGGIPATILLLDYNLVQKHCYDRARLITLGFLGDKAKVIHADVDGLKYQPKYLEKYQNGELGDNYANHCFVEREEKDGRTWVYDTSLGYVIEKNLYYKMQNPKITKIEDFKDTIDYLYNIMLDEDNINLSKYIQKILEEIEKNQKPVQECYKEKLKKEIERFKSSTSSKEFKKEVQKEKKILRKIK